MLLLELLPQKRAAAWSCDRFVLGGGVEALDLLPVIVAQALNRVAKRLGGLAQLSDLVGRVRDGALDCRPSLMARFLECVAQRRNRGFKLGDVALIRCADSATALRSASLSSSAWRNAAIVDFRWRLSSSGSLSASPSARVSSSVMVSSVAWS